MVAFLQGLGTGAGLIIAIGAQNAFVLSQGVRKDNHWLVASICSLCDALLIFLGAAGVGAIVARNPVFRDIAGWAGAVFLFSYGFRALKAALRPGVLTADAQGREKGSRAAVIAATLAVTFLNPHVYLDTLVMIGSISGQYTGNGRYAFAFGASSASCLWFFTLSLGGIVLAPVFRDQRAWRILDVVVCATMWTIAVQIVPIA